MMTYLTDTQREAVHLARADSMKEAIAELVDSGTITQDVADNLSEYRKKPDDGSGIRVLTQEESADMVLVNSPAQVCCLPIQKA